MSTPTKVIVVGNPRITTEELAALLAKHGIVHTTDQAKMTVSLVDSIPRELAALAGLERESVKVVQGRMEEYHSTPSRRRAQWKDEGSYRGRNR